MSGKDLGDRLSEVRRRSGLSVPEFAASIGVSVPVLKNYASERTPMPDMVAERISEQYGVSVGWIMGSEEKPGQIPYFDVDAMATPIGVFNDQTTAPAYFIDMPGFHDCDFAINVYGHSMYPTIESGMIVLCKKVQDISLLMYGEVYFIVTSDFRMVKRLLKSDNPGHIIAASDNHNGHASPDGKTYAPVEIPIAKILHLYVVKGVFKRCLI